MRIEISLQTSINVYQNFIAKIIKCQTQWNSINKKQAMQTSVQIWTDVEISMRKWIIQDDIALWKK